MINSLLRILSADTPSKPATRAKIRGAVLPVEYDLERFISNVTNPSSTWTVANHAFKWDGVRKNRDEVVGEIVWQGRSLSGTLCWEYMPSTLTFFDIQDNRMAGEVTFSVLPHTLKTLTLSRNCFTGHLDMASVPRTLSALFLVSNRFHGEVRTRQIYPELAYFYISDNPDLTGSIVQAQLANPDVKLGSMLSAGYIGNTQVEVH